MKTFFILIVAASACAESGLEVPTLGAMLDSGGAVRPVGGVAGSFVIGDPWASSIISMACSDRLCLAKTAASIVSTSGVASAPEGPALFAIDGAQAFIYFPQSHQFARWHDGVMNFSALEIPGEILSLRSTQGALEFAVRRRGRVFTVNLDNQTLNSLGPTAGPVLLLDHGILFSRRGQLVLRRFDGSESIFTLGAPDSMLRMSSSYVEIRAAGRAYALRIDSGREQLFALPEALP